MGKFLLDSKSSVNFNLGTAQQLIPPTLEERIIRFKVPRIDLSELANFFGAYSNINEDSVCGAVAEFFLEKFFESVKNTGRFDSVNYFEGIPGEVYSSGHVSYEFIRGAKTIKAYNKDKSQIITEISRIIDIRKDNDRHVVICDPRGRGNLKRNPYPNLKVARELTRGSFKSGHDTTSSFMPVYAIDMFGKELSNKSYSGLLPYFQEHSRDICLTYSLNSVGVSKLGLKALKLLQN